MNVSLLRLLASTWMHRLHYTLYSAYMELLQFIQINSRRAHYTINSEYVELIIHFIQNMKSSLFSLFRMYRAQYRVYSGSEELILLFIQNVKSSLYSLLKISRAYSTVYSECKELILPFIQHQDRRLQTCTITKILRLSSSLECALVWIRPKYSSGCHIKTWTHALSYVTQTLHRPDLSLTQRK